MFKRQSIRIYLLFDPSNMDFQEQNFELSLTRVTL